MIIGLSGYVRRCVLCHEFVEKTEFQGTNRRCNPCLKLLTESVLAKGNSLIKKCSKCKEEKSVLDFHQSVGRKDGFYPQCNVCYTTNKIERLKRHPYNPDKRRKYVSDYRKRFPERTKESDKNMNLKSFGISLKSYNTILESQNNLCAICKGPQTGLSPKGNIKSLAVDHCHTSDRVRGLLCSNCNTALGLFNDSIESLGNAIKYLEVSK